MQILPISQNKQDSSLLVSTKNMPLLQAGEIVQAEVLTVTDTEVAIRLRNTILEARTDLPLKKGDVLSLLVEEEGQEIRLHLVPGDSTELGSIKNVILSALDSLKGLKPAPDDVHLLSDIIATMPQSLKDTLPGLNALEKMMTSLEGLSGALLKTIVQDSGVFFEAKLRLTILGEGQESTEGVQKLQELAKNDLKAVLLSLKEELGNSAVMERLIQNGTPADTIAAVVDNLLKNVEFLQLQSRLSNTLQVLVPFVWRDLKDGELIFRESERERPGEPAYLCTVSLNLERSGKMCAHVLFQTGQIYVDILTENETFSKLLQSHAALLKDRFDTVGIKIGGLTLRQESRIDIKPDQAGGLNIRI